MTTGKISRGVGLLSLALVVVLLASASGCAGGQQAPAAKEKVLNVHLYSRPVPTVNLTGEYIAIFEKLVMFNEKFEVVPGACERFEVSADGTRWTFHLPKNSKWHDGKPFTAEDVVFSLHVYANPRTGSNKVGQLSQIKGAKEFAEGNADSIAGITAPDSHTVVIELAQPNVAFAATVLTGGIFMLPKHILGSVPADQLEKHSFWRDNPVGTGPFKQVKFVEDQYIEVVKYKDYWRGEPKIDRMFMKVLTSDVAVAQMEKGELDIAKISATDASRLDALPNVRVESVPGMGINSLIFNLQQPYLKDKRVRQAFWYAINRKDMLDTILGGHGKLVCTPIIAPEWAVNPNLNPYEYNPDKARQLLREAGWDSNRKLVMTYFPGIRDRDAGMPVIQQQMKEVGVNIELKPVDLAIIQATYLKGTKDWDIYAGGGGMWAADPAISGLYFISEYKTPKGYNGAHYENPEVDALYKQGAATADKEARKRVYYRIQEILNDEVPWLWLYRTNEIYALNERVTGIKVHGGVTELFWDCWEWDVKQ